MPMAGSTFNKAIHNCGMECALRRFNRKCLKRFGSKACLACKWNIEAYVNADPRHVRLFMLQCEHDAQELKSRASLPWGIFVAGFLIVLFLGIMHYRYNKKYGPTQFEASQPTAATRQAHLDDEIWATMSFVTRDLNKKVDVNGDGQINCIDASVLFYQYFPDKDRVCIEVNYNPKTKWHHAFNCVKINGVWRGIEPQSLWKKGSSYWMKDVWAKKYDSSYNQDETEIYKKYVRK